MRLVFCMNRDDRITVLRNVDLFFSFSEDELTSFAQNIEEVEYAPGEILLEEGREGHNFYVLLKGKLSVAKGKRILSEITPVGYVGEMAIIESKPRSATVKALEKSTLLRIPADLFQEYLLEKPRAMLAIMKILSQRIRLDNEVLVREFEQTNILVHDMRNLLSIFLFLDTIDPETGAVRKKHIKFMKTARLHLSRLVEQALANVRSLVIPERVRDNSLTALIDEMKESDFVIHPDLQDRNIVVVHRAEIPPFHFSKLQIRRVLSNLIINAAQASKQTSDIEIGTDLKDCQAVISVTDYGPGISDADKDRIFDLHFTSKSDGNGLGLASCKQIVETDHCGCLLFNSIPGQGTVFTVSLPLEGC